ncbi:hypothetical protein B6V75_15765 [Thioclava sp. F1Mire-8]|uniref:ferredoxin--NADP reductase n=1 Tax=Thioclava sp. F1Mire-8 TaxID=1973006 RepID=UPI000B53918E|nr:hypothetical protein [Thioclava sp. F1Mire-8]OWY01074.1 hypothetical protein B6V75_15765 [Thioclava sp. F1Mire-8]
MMRLIRRALNGVTMYRLMVYYLGLLFVGGLAAGMTGATFLDPAGLLLSLALAVASAWVTNRLFSIVLKLPTNSESVHITALILALIMPPADIADPTTLAAIVLASVAAIASKFILTIGHKHIFNPVALGAVVAGIGLNTPALWWVGGTPQLLPLVILGGLLVGYKIERLGMIAVYILSNLAAVIATTPPGMMGMALQQTLLYSPLFFAGFAMLTEPLTAAHGRWSRHVYAAIVGVLSCSNIHIGTLYFSPELAFLVANIYAWAASPKGRFKMKLIGVEEIAANCYEFVFQSDRALKFRAGQYLDWTLGLPKSDTRGNRRTFTIASAPGATSVRVGVKFTPDGSEFKRGLLEMQEGDPIYGSQIAGTFVLPRQREKKLLFIAGGIGITPFRSMIADLLERGEKRDIVLVYANRSADEIAYRELLTRARSELGMKVVYAVSGAPGDASTLPGTVVEGRMDETKLRECVPDLDERRVYVSGASAMVAGFRKTLRNCGVGRRRIHTDAFSGL